MGNSASAPHNKLSKPKTNTNSPYASPKVGSSSISLSIVRHEDVDTSSPIDSVVRAPSGDYRSRQEVRHQLRADLTSAMDAEVSFSSDEDDNLGELATHVQARLSNLSRSNSVISQMASAQTSTTRLVSLPGSKVSLVPESVPVDLDTALKILQELRKNASPEDIAALHQALLPSQVSEYVITTSRPPISGSTVNHRSRTSSLIRRRSLATPGVATRFSPSDSLRGSSGDPGASLNLDDEEPWKVEMMGTSPLARLAGLDQSGRGQDSPAPRAQTPGDMQYSHLGSLQLGSLHVTNGAVSPAPSIISRHMDSRNGASNHSQSHEEDYFTASEGHASPIMWKKGEAKSQTSVLPIPTYLDRQERKPRRERNTNNTTRTGSPLIKESRPQELVDDSKTQGSRVTSFDYAQDYMAEIQSSPFVDTFNHDRVAGEHFAETRARDSTLFREEASSTLDRTIFCADDHSFNGANGQSIETHSGDSIVPVQQRIAEPFNKSHENGHERPTPIKADSGYSFGESVRVMQGERQTPEERFVPTIPRQTSVLSESHESRVISGCEDASSLYTFEQMLSLHTQNPLPEIPNNKGIKHRPSRLSWRRSSSSIARISSTPPTPLSVSGHSVVSSSSSSQKRLQKRQLSYLNLPVVQACRPVIEGSIPDIPDGIRSHFTRRLSEQPDMSHLTHTFASIADTTSAAEGSPISSSPLDMSLANRPRRHTRTQSERPPTPPPHRHRRLSLLRKTPEAEKRQSNDAVEDTIDLLDLGTVAQSLGGSPYDIAIPKRMQASIISPTHPHQLGKALPRPKSLVNMDAASASEVSRMRSRERSLSRGSSQRPRSYHEFNLEAGEAAAFTSRPHSSNVDTPPVPKIEPHRLSLVRASSHRINDDIEPLIKTEGSKRPKLFTRDTSVSQLVESFNRYAGEKEQPDWESHSRHWRQRRESAVEGLQQNETSSRPGTSSTTHRKDDSILDRYSGGLAYGYEYGFGVGGSAGTRHLRSGASRKSQHFSNQFGIDLSDVPVFLQKAH